MPPSHVPAPEPKVHAHSVQGDAAAELQSSWRAHLAERLPLPGWRTRFAPAPTGYLHLGHLVNALYVWGVARAYGGQVVLRIEDHDRLRCRDEYEVALLEDLAWLGFEADIAPTTSYRTGDRPVASHPFRQSDNTSRYASALEALERAGLVYACACTRRTIAQLVPTAPGEEPRYPGTCADRHVDPTSTMVRRVRMSPGVESFDDLRLGRIDQSPAMQCGDVLVRDRHGSWTYQFAVTVDDFEQDIDVIIRGEDLLASTGRQRQLARLLGRTTMPLVLHHPLLVHADGAKLSKASRDTSLRERRADGASAEELLGEAAFLAGLAQAPAPISAHEIARLFR